ncbi:MAG: hypothetical protein ACJ796_14260 [Gemmatimonadaceae bacterium]
MASEKEAHLAREEHSEYLRSLGAHAIAVDQVDDKGRDGFGVIAMFEKKPSAVPKSLDVTVGKKRVSVPLKIQKAERFRAE